MDLSFSYLKKFDFESVLKFATIGLLGQKGLKKEVLRISLVLVIILFLLVFFFGAAFVSSYFLVIGELELALILSVISVLLFLSVALTGSYFTYVVYSFALKSIGKKSIKFDLKLGVKLIFCGVYRILIAIFCLYELKLLLWLIGGLIFFFIGFALILVDLSNILLVGAGSIFIVISLILFLFYYLVVIRNSIRLLFANILLIEQNLSINDALKKSWEISAGKVAPIFIIQLILGGVVWGLQQIISIVFQSVLAPLEIVLDLTMTSGEVLLPMVVGALFLILIFIVLSFILTIFSELISVFAQAKIYTQIQPKRVNVTKK
ncbi:MAG: hypothetical protein BWY55_00800 [archaeon ADurb.Bin336]|nr:MAG: hypothetical protein BWY55_00800 [archaeon ADurb.Bin336]